MKALIVGWILMHRLIMPIPKDRSGVHLFISNTGTIKPLHNGTVGDEYFAPILRILKEHSQNVEETITISRFDPFAAFRKRIPMPEVFFRFSDVRAAERDVRRPEFVAYERAYPKTPRFAMALYYRIFRRYLEHVKPKCVVFVAGYTKMYSMILAARELNIPTVELQHGRIHPEHHIYMNDDPDWLWPTHFITQSEHTKRILASGPLSADQVHALGIPRYDFLARYKPDTNALRARLDIASKKPILFWPTQTHDELMNENGENAANADAVFTAALREGWYVLLKPHPNEPFAKSKRFYESRARRVGFSDYRFIHPEAVTTYECIAISSATVIKHSTVGIESLLMRTPVINLELIESHPLLPYRELDTFLVVHSEDELVEALKTVRSPEHLSSFDKAAQKFAEHEFANFGKASEAVARFLEHLTDTDARSSRT
jgi:hypothetical protein